MNLYHLTQGEVNYYDTYSDCVVAAESAKAAVYIYIPMISWCGGTAINGCARLSILTVVRLVGRMQMAMMSGPCLLKSRQS